ncbi:MAG: MarR family winged helix-turn-helix transcriptional regulator [Pseudomonadota bacterium]
MAKPPTSHGALRTVGLPALLSETGEDAQFRDFMADLFAAGSCLRSVRRALGEATGLSGAAIAMLLGIQRLGAQGSVSVSALATHLHVAQPFATAEVGKLAKLGLVIKHASKADGRGIELELTANGVQQLAQLTSLTAIANDTWFSGVGITEIRHVQRFLRRLIEQSQAAVAAVETAELAST